MQRLKQLHMVACTNPMAGTKLQWTNSSSKRCLALTRASTLSRPLVLRVNETYLPANPVKSFRQSESVAEGHVVHLVPAIDYRRVDCCCLRIVATASQSAVFCMRSPTISCDWTSLSDCAGTQKNLSARHLVHEAAGPGEVEALVLRQAMVCARDVRVGEVEHLLSASHDNGGVALHL